MSEQQAAPSVERPAVERIARFDINDELDITSSEKLGKLVHDLHYKHMRIGFAQMLAPALDA